MLTALALSDHNLLDIHFLMQNLQCMAFPLCCIAPQCNVSTSSLPHLFLSLTLRFHHLLLHSLWLTSSPFLSISSFRNTKGLSDLSYHIQSTHHISPPTMLLLRHQFLFGVHYLNSCISFFLLLYSYFSTSFSVPFFLSSCL